ncbi:MAG: penicillin-binding protein 1C [Saprospiraceae bacterium]|nr:penicillin-binding protein 1C [Saprospiraceae bacterium]
MLIIIPLPKYKLAFSKALYSNEGKLLSAIISSEQQWCFPMEEAVPDKLKSCIIAYEDEYFKYHPGINPISLFKAMADNFEAGKPIRGASTITMQVMRMKNKHAKRSLVNKGLEMLGAIKYTVLHSKSSILREWVEIAPFGGNTIGVKAASLRYFGRSVDNLSWGEYALLAVMPNGPSTANLTKNRDKLKSKRDFLLTKLHKLRYFDLSELQLYLGEDIPTETKAIPQFAYHALMYLANTHPDTYIFRSTMPYDIQIRINELLIKESSFLKMDDIRNISAVIIDVKTNKLVSYIGNVSAEKNQFSYVDIAQSARSYGSLLKPLLYAYTIENTYLLPNEMVADIPTSIGDFQPMNFDKKFRGAVPFEDMLIQSLNVPSVRVLNTVGLQGFYDLIRQLDIVHLDKGVDHYGLSIILGGGESSLWDLCRVYKGFAQNYQNIPGPFRQVQCLENEQLKLDKQTFSFSGSTMDYLVKAMSDLTRPREEKSWDRYGTDYKIAWKTGTSYGHKDAWALGFNGQYMVGVWVGNEGGEGRFDLTGITKAAPVMFKIFSTLPDNQWFATPPVYSKKEIITICLESGKLAGPLCKHKSKITTDKTSYKYIGCNYHKEVRLNKANLVISEECKQYEIRKDTVFMLPSYMEYYYKTAHNDYHGMPEFDPTCKPSTSNFKIIYPNDGLKIFLPKESLDKQNELIAKAYHNEPNTDVYWFVDDKYMLNTKNEVEHNGRFILGPGRHKLTVTDQWGHRDEVNFEILGED